MEGENIKKNFGVGGREVHDLFITLSARKGKRASDHILLLISLLHTNLHPPTLLRDVTSLGLSTPDLAQAPDPEVPQGETSGLGY